MTAVEVTSSNTPAEGPNGPEQPDSRSRNSRSQKGSGERSRFARFVLRPFILAFVFVCLVFAVLQATGRILLHWVHVFEPDINLMLSQQNIGLRNLTGGWHGLNPTLRVEALTTPQFQAGNAFIEVDVLESIWRNELVARTLTVGEVELRAVKSAHGWSLRGFTGAPAPFDVATFLRHSDAIQASVTVVLEDALVASTSTNSRDWVMAQVNLRNTAGQHAAEVVVSTSAAVSGEVDASASTLQLYVQQVDANRWLQQPASTNLSASGRLRVPQVLLNGLNADLAVTQASWSQALDGGAGQVGLTVQLENAYTQTPLVVELATLMRATGELFELGITPLVRVEESTLTLAQALVRIDTEQLLAPDDAHLFAQLVSPEVTQDMVELWLPEVDLGAVGGFIREHFGAWDPAGRWIRELALTGQARNVHAFVDQDMRIGYGATLVDLNMQGYKGAPTLRGAQGEVWGHPSAVSFRVNAQDLYLQFPDLYHNAWDLNYISGVVTGWFGPGYFALRGEGLKTQIGDSAIAGEFSLTRPDPRYEQRVGLLLHVDQAPLERARTFVPYKIPADLQRWLDSGPKAGTLRDARFAYQGQVHTRPGELGRRNELMAQMYDAQVYYESNWPLVEDLEAFVHVAGANTRVEALAGTSLGLDISGSQFELAQNARFVHGQLQVKGDGEQVLNFIRTSPLQETLQFVEDDWQMQGPVVARGPLTIPLRDDAPPLAVGFDFELNSVDLELPGYRTAFADLEGAGRFDLPHHVTGQFTGLMFGEKTQITADYSDQWVHFDLNGRATPQDVYDLIEYEDSVPVQGQFEFAGRLNLPMQGADDIAPGLTNLHVKSDLVGLLVDLPSQFGKLEEDLTPVELDVQFLTDYQAVRWEYKTTHGWLHVGDGIERGAIGIDAPPPMTSADTRALVISGHMPRLLLSDWVSDTGESSVALPLDWDIRGLHVDEFVIDELKFKDLNLSGSQIDDNVWFSFDSEDLAGSVELPGQDVMQVSLSRLRLPESVAVVDEVDVVEQASAGTDAVDDGVGQVTAESLSKPEPLSKTEPWSASQPGTDEFLIGVEVGQTLPHARVRIDNLFIADEAFGSWGFLMVPEFDSASADAASVEPLSPTFATAVRFDEFYTDVNGVHIENGALKWDLATNTSHFSGALRLDNLEKTLPLWDYPAALSTRKAKLTVDGQWPGSPVDISLLELDGELGFVASDGRFLEVDAGAGGLRMLSLVNFSKAAKRFSFDFSDVVGEGISFDSLSTKVALAQGQLSFLERMRLKGSSGAYQLGGKVDLRSGTLDNEMIVTLPVSNSLPWYGVYLALANPLAGLGVLVGERVLRKPLEQFSSAKFTVTGDLDDPQIKFVSLWDQSMKEVESAPDAPETNEASAQVGDVTDEMADQVADQMTSEATVEVVDEAAAGQQGDVQGRDSALTDPVPPAPSAPKT